MKAVTVYNKAIYKETYFLKGYMFIGDKLVTQKNVREFFEGKSFEEIKETVFSANGFFSLSIQCDEFTAVFTDKLRSIPLYFMEYEGDLYISDSCKYLAELSGYEIDSSAVDEYRLSGFVSGKYTLFEYIYQMESSSFLYKRDNSYSYKHYFRMQQIQPGCLDIERPLEELDSCYLNCLKRTIKYLDGRTAVVPLSGGQDSRLIVLTLKRLGYENVITFSYGVENNTESRISRMIAEELGYKWYFVEYNNENWDYFTRNEQFNDYLLYSADYSSYPHIQDWPAVFYLKENNLIPDDSVFVPGHSGDFLAGSHLPAYLENSQLTLTKDDLLAALIQKHFSLWPMYNSSKKDIVINRIARNIETMPEQLDNIKFAAELQLFNMVERQSKLICNSVRVYDFFGYDYSIPLWDDELIQFWSSLGLSQLINRRFYYDYAKNYVYPLLGETGKKLYSDEKKTIESSYAASPKNKPWHKRPLWLKIARGGYTAYCRAKQLYNHPLNWFRIFSLGDKLYFIVKRGESISSLIIKRYLKLIMNMKNHNTD